MPKAFTENEKSLIRKRLLEQGYKQFSAYGLQKTNVEDIARAVGISKGAFYRFYGSKEALFMEVIEQAETSARQELMTAINIPAPTPRARLFAVLKKAVTLFKGIPILQFFTSSDYDLLFRRLPAEKLQEHLANDRVFFDELIAACQQAGIPIRAPTDQIIGLLFLLVPAILQEDILGQDIKNSSVDLHLELLAAFCLGEVELQLQRPSSLPQS